jgi:hypothetical protein
MTTYCVTILLLFSKVLDAQSIDFPLVDGSITPNYWYCLNFFQDIPRDNIRIKKKEQLIPLTTIPSIWNLFRKKENWTYKINISTKTMERLSPILYDSLSLDGQIGVLAHELSHVQDFQTNSKKYMLKIFINHLSSKKMDAFEFNTDLICIKQGMGHFLYQWSADVQKNLNIDQWKGKKTFAKDVTNERYMRPETICTYINSMKELYQDKTPTACIN